MSWFKRVFGFRGELDSQLSPEVAAIFEKIYRYLNDEQMQNDHAPEPYRTATKSGIDCDEIPGAVGEFGRDVRNPIPVNGPIGEVIYLSNLRREPNQVLFFHRLGSIGRLDIYELVDEKADGWDVLILDCYHPRKSKRAPRGYYLASGKERSALFFGSNSFVPKFPMDLQIAVREASKRFLGVDWGPPEIRFALERQVFTPPPAHATSVKEILLRLHSKAPPAGVAGL